ncbi:hypothetical protein SAMN05216388_10455 [Halorientalis persicus]|uniref:Uncharacterized protein n=1 Tax=Halorientalis persicus TaxID=1367881 RepID=A0A1H8W152_9EURY|nr:hypothetical protein SAMN05216388_10455 [Halorientalis persicus]
MDEKIGLPITRPDAGGLRSLSIDRATIQKPIATNSTKTASDC